MTDPRVEALAQYKADHWGTDRIEPPSHDVFREAARQTIELCEAAGLLVLADNAAAAECISDALSEFYAEERALFDSGAHAVLRRLRSPFADQIPDHIRSLAATSPSITAGCVERVQHAAAQCHKALTDESVTEESARAWLRTIVRGLLGTDEWADDFDRSLDEWAESYRAARAESYRAARAESPPPADSPAAGGVPGDGAK